MRRATLPLLAAIGLSTAICGLTEADEPRPIVAEGRQPQAAVDTSGRVHLVYGLGSEIRYIRSDDDGKSFTEPVVVGGLPKLALGMRRGPRVAATPKAIVVVAAGGSKEVQMKGYKMLADGDLQAWRSVDGGKSWSGPARINSISGSAREGLHALTVAPDGTFFTAWLDLRSQTMEVYGARSTDGGSTWSDEGRIYRSPDKAICPCCHPSAAFAPDGSLHVMWRNQILGHRDLYLSTSTDGGKSFGDASKLGEGTWSFNACPMDGGAIAARDKDSIDTIWMREGRTFAARPGQAERSLGRGVQGWAASGQGGTYFGWLSARPGRLNIIKPGSDKPVTLAPSANDPMIASSPTGKGPVVAVWEIPAETPTSSAATAKHDAHDGHAAKAAGAIAFAILSPGR